MISLKQLRAEAKRVLGPRGNVNASSRLNCEAYRCKFGRNPADPSFVAIRVSAESIPKARAVLLSALYGMPDFEADQ